MKRLSSRSYTQFVFKRGDGKILCYAQSRDGIEVSPPAQGELWGCFQIARVPVPTDPPSAWPSGTPSLLLLSHLGWVNKCKETGKIPVADLLFLKALNYFKES